MPTGKQLDVSAVYAQCGQAAMQQKAACAAALVSSKTGKVLLVVSGADESSKDPLQHSLVRLLSAADERGKRVTGNWVVTLVEPCAGCAAFLVTSGVELVVYGLPCGEHTGAKELVMKITDTEAARIWYRNAQKFHVSENNLMENQQHLPTQVGGVLQQQGGKGRWGV